MASGLKLQIEGLEQLKKKLGGIPENVKNELEPLISEAADDFVNRAIDDAPRDEGLLIQGISQKKVGDMDFEVVSSAGHAAYLEFGTRRRVKIPSDLKEYASQFQGKGGGGGEGFYEHILAWVKRKGIRYESAATYKSGEKKGKNKTLDFETTAYIIYHHLLFTGIKAQPYFFKQREPVMEELNKKASAVIQKVLSK